MAEYVNSEIAWSRDFCLSPFLVVTTMCITMGKSLSVWAGLYSFFFSPSHKVWRLKWWSLGLLSNPEDR